MMPWLTAVLLMLGLMLFVSVTHLLRIWGSSEKKLDVLSHSSCCGGACTGSDRCSKDKTKETNHETE